VHASCRIRGVGGCLFGLCAALARIVLVILGALTVQTAWATSKTPGTPRREKSPGSQPGTSPALLWREVQVPETFLATARVKGQRLRYGGDIRLGDLTGNGQADLLVFRCDKASALKPCFLGAFDLSGRALWQVGSGGTQPLRPGPVAVHDIDGDGHSQVICFFQDPSIRAGKKSMADVVVQIRDGRTGKVKRQTAPPEIRQRAGWGPNWCHHRIFVCNLRGRPTPQDFIIKLGDTIVALDDALSVLWTYTIRWNDYGKCSAYIPSVGDIDGDGRDEVNGGYFLLDSDGRPIWEKRWGPHMDSVAITAWDDGRMRAICSGGGHVIDADGKAVLALGAKIVPHGQEVRVADFLPDLPGPEMIVRYNGHTPNVMVVSNAGEILRRFELNASPNETGMEVVYWNGPKAPALLHNGGLLFDGAGRQVVTPPGLHKPVGPAKMGWYHCIPADVCGDAREEMILYNPWAASVFIYTPAPLRQDAYAGYHPGPRQYNARLMD